jgi:hypothetical protein
MKKYNLFLDDFRHPYDAFQYTFDPVFSKLKWEIVRSHDEFVKHITKKFKKGEFPEIIAFDHDLDDAHYEHTTGSIPYEEMKEKTGMHSAKWLIDFCIDNNLNLPDYRVHSMNPAGRENIKSLLANFKKHQESDKAV